MQQLTDLEIMRYIPRTLTTEIEMNTQPEALRLADLLTTDAYWSPMLGEQAAAEIRRLHAAREECERQYQVKCDEIGALHEVNQELLEALKDAAQCVQDNYLPDMMGHDWDHIIAKATGERA